VDTPRPQERGTKQEKGVCLTGPAWACGVRYDSRGEGQRGAGSARQVHHGPQIESHPSCFVRRACLRDDLLYRYSMQGEPLNLVPPEFPEVSAFGPTGEAHIEPDTSTEERHQKVARTLPREVLLAECSSSLMGRTESSAPVEKDDDVSSCAGASTVSEPPLPSRAAKIMPTLHRHLQRAWCASWDC
jgi:hypothetical protein